MLQSLRELARHDRYVPSHAHDHAVELRDLQRRMADYYSHAPYPVWVRSLTAHWREDLHRVQIALCALIPPGSRVLDVGCGDGSSVCEIRRRTRGISYVGCDLSAGEWTEANDLVIASADMLAFPDRSMDVVLSMYVIEHLVFPARFLDECWRVLRPGGRLLIIAPDFTCNGMASERIGLSYGSGIPKLRRLHIFDALLTFYDTRVRIPQLRQRRKHRIDQGVCEFPVLTRPRCLNLPGFVPDCDAIYPACPNEIMRYMTQSDCAEARLFCRDAWSFGLLLSKQADCKG